MSQLALKMTEEQRPVVQTPLLPVALAVTAGIMLDRYADLPPIHTAVGVLICLMLWLVTWKRRRSSAAVVFLWLAAGLLGGLWHHVRQMPGANDIGRYVTSEGQLAKLRGIVSEKTTYEQRSADEDTSLRTRASGVRTRLTIETTELWDRDQWLAVEGPLNVRIADGSTSVRVGDEVELIGELREVEGMRNPGEYDTRQFRFDQGIRGDVFVKGSDAVRSIRASSWSPERLLVDWRERSSQYLREALTDANADVAVALLIGDQSPLADSPRKAYFHTGVIHVLAISGQHLVILCGSFWWVLRRCGCSWRRASWFIPMLVATYGIFVGLQPSVFRAVIIVVAFSVGVLARRRSYALNSLVLAWLTVTAINPGDLFQIGCQLSFLSVLVLYQVLQPLQPTSASFDTLSETVYDHPKLFWMTAPRTGLELLIEESRPHWQRLLLAIARWAAWSFFTCFVMWATCAPLIAARVHLVSPIAVLIGPVMILLTSIALLAGFPLLVLCWIHPALGWPFAKLMNVCLSVCEAVVRWGESIPLSHWYTSGLPEWWLWLFYIGLIMVLVSSARRWLWKPAILIGLMWLVVGLFAQSSREVADELRCTFLAVGHGSCVVLETPDGRVFLYDAGSLAGPEVANRQIAPFLWSRGITHIDEVFLSHADLDHFNGIPDLVDRFSVSQVSWTPTFRYKPERGVQMVTHLLRNRGVPVRELTRGQRLQAGGVVFDVLHPPTMGPDGPENARSLVLLVTYKEMTLLLTGDLESPGLEQVTATPILASTLSLQQRVRVGVDVLMAPHHGSGTSNTVSFAEWSKPGLVVSSEGRPRGKKPDPYHRHGSTVWRTWNEGAVTVRFDDRGVQAETYRTNQVYSSREAR